MNMQDYLQIIALVSGVIFMVMQVFQHRLMWYFGLLTSGAAAGVALLNFSESGLWAPLWALAGLNMYTFTMDIVGIFRWKKFDTGGKIHIVKLPRKHILYYSAAILTGAPLLFALLSFTNDPAPVADAIAFTVSIAAQVMLVRSHLEQWILWIIANVVTIVIYSQTGAWWMVALYYCYCLNCCLGLYNWREKGVCL